MNNKKVSPTANTDLWNKVFHESDMLAQSDKFEEEHEIMRQIIEEEENCQMIFGPFL